MFNFRDFPYTDFTQINMNWILSKLPVDISDQIQILNDWAGAVLALKLDNYVILTYNLYKMATNFPINEVVFELPYKSINSVQSPNYENGNSAITIYAGTSQFVLSTAVEYQTARYYTLSGTILLNIEEA